MSALNVRKLANAFIRDATPSAASPRAVLWAVERFRRCHGGLWVGGTVVASDRGVSFTPNRLNQIMHKGLQAVEVRAQDIRAVRHEFGWITGIVVVEHAHGEFRFRCYAARRLAAAMAEHFKHS